MRIKGTITVKRSSKLEMYHHLMEKAMACKDWESYDFWSYKFDIEWLKIFGSVKRKEVK